MATTKTQAPTPATDARTSAQIRGKTEELDRQVSTLRDRIAALTREKKQLAPTALTGGDEKAKTRYDELQLKLVLAERELEDLTAAQEPIRTELATALKAALARERKEAIAKTEERLAEAERAAEDTARAVLEVARGQLAAAVKLHAAALDTHVLLSKRLEALDADTVGRVPGDLQLDSLARRVCELAGLGAVIPRSWHLYELEREGRTLYARGKSDGGAAAAGGGIAR